MCHGCATCGGNLLSGTTSVVTSASTILCRLGETTTTGRALMISGLTYPV